MDVLEICDQIQDNLKEIKKFDEKLNYLYDELKEINFVVGNILEVLENEF